MDKEKAKELAKILLAYSEGKRIEVSNNNNSWIATSSMELITSSKYVRIKPASKLVPFTFEDRDLFKDKWVKEVGKVIEWRITGISPVDIRFGGTNYYYNSAFKLIEFADGTPFGKYINE